ncbi:MAG TPA: class I SAM-dependent methyltransferase, partial [Longimicrobium sp.]|nr:class I SAM-dependent methyltransferase [Longimicrobium sp.]
MQAPPASPRCQICGGQSAQEYRAREMMYGLREEFRYFQCAECGCVQIREFPDDMARFYAGYGSYDEQYFPTGLRLAAWAARNRYTFTGRGLLGRLLSRVNPYHTPGAARWLAGRGLGLDARIMDVGSGSGGLLLALRAAGYHSLLGVDPFLPKDIHYPNGVVVLRRRMQEVEGEFDVIMFHHVLEHVPDQLDTMRAVAERLAPGGFCLVRIPMASSEAWEKYRENWVQLDPPRHFFMHTEKSIRLLAEQAGLRVASVEYDSTAFQFEASELYLRDVPLNDQAG